MHRLIAFALCAFALTLTAAPRDAHAGVPEDALALALGGKTEEAASRLTEWVRAQPAVDASALTAARAAAEIGDPDLLERLQGWLEGRPETKEPGPATLALAVVWLARAEGHLARQDGGSATAFLLADAAAKANACIDSPVGADALVLSARVRYVQGDSPGALAALEARPDLLGQPGPAALHGQLIYERALASGLGADGQLTEAGRADMRAAVADVDTALADAAALGARSAASTRLTRAYALHRLGDVAAAAEAYQAAHLGEPSGDRALRGLKSLFAQDPTAYRRALRGLLDERPADVRVNQALAWAQVEAQEVEEALRVAEAFAEAAPTSAEAPLLAGYVLVNAGRLAEAEARFLQAHALDGTSRAAVAGLEQVAMQRITGDGDVERGIAIYEGLFRRQPADPFVRNNLGFLLREAVTPHTTIEPNGVQRLKLDAPFRARAWLARSIAAYAEAVALIPEAQDKDLDDAQAWNLAGIVNDYALMLHYFADAQDLPHAEALYWRALRMTRFGFKDTYAPNLQRLYGTLLPQREWSWYLAAREARDAILLETGVGADGNPTLAPDAAKRQAASRDVDALRARLVRTLRADAESDGVPFPEPEAPASGGGSGR